MEIDLGQVGEPVFVGDLRWNQIAALRPERIRRWLFHETDAGASVWVEPENHARAVELTTKSAA